MMRLAKVTLSGFKSFADRTEFTFDDPITGVVGPNGCGKSNIVDAIKWVLGERSPKSLRSKEMQDVIFAGSAGRAPGGLASVTLSFENPLLETPIQPRKEDRALAEFDDDEPSESGLIERGGVRRRPLPIDSEVVDVERRLYRDGASQYLINGRKARLRDIRELFLDTGVGADAYSIIEQGKVDAMLLSSPTERRTIFEEAAGIARFKARRIEAHRKLERAEMNLVRAREQLDSTERRLRSVRNQAAKARRFREMDARLRGLRLALMLHQYDELCSRLDGLTSQQCSLEEGRRSAAESVERIEQDKQNAELHRHDLAVRQRDIETQLRQAEHEVSHAAQREQLTRGSLEESASQIEADRRRLDSIMQSDAAIAEQSKELDDAVIRLEAAITDSEQKVCAVSEHRAELQSAQVDARRQLSEKESAAARISRDHASLVARRDSLESRVAAQREDIRRREENISQLAAEQESLISSRLDAERSAERQHSVIAEKLSHLHSVEEQADSLTDNQRRLGDRVASLEQRHSWLDSRRQTLREMVEAHVGLGEAPIEVLRRRDSDGPDGLFASIIAPLADLVQADAPDAAAVEAALGANLHALVIASAPRLIDSGALSELPGRVVFLSASSHQNAPSAEIARGEHDAQASQPAGLFIRLEGMGVTPLYDLVRCDARAHGIVHRLLKRTYLAPNLDAAFLLASGPMQGARFVTRTGEVFETEGRLTAGAGAGQTEGGGLLQRRAELRSLDAEIASLDDAIAEGRMELRSIDERVAAMTLTRSAARQSLADEERTLISIENDLERLATDIARLDREIPRQRAEQSRNTESLDALLNEQRELFERAGSLERLHIELNRETDALRIEHDERHASLEEAGERLASARVLLTKQSEQLSSLRAEARHAQSRRAELAREQNSIETHLRSSADRCDEFRRIITESIALRDAAHAAGEEARTELESTHAESASAIEHCAAIAEQLEGALQQARLIERDWNAVELSRREFEIKRESIEQRATEELEFDLHGELTAYRTLTAEEEIIPIDPEQTAAEVDHLRDEVRRLGAVNHDSIEEESRLEERNEDLARQVADMDAARTSLETLIVRLSDASRTRFQEVFETIRAAFAGESGMFCGLFGGGAAEIRLLPCEETGEVDWLESGVEIIASPPGKKPRTINQLSGGEKTMTAVALLMSIFQSKISPFCLLDEVDAALDDANVERFCDIVRQFLDRSHFIIVTHNRRTMQYADRLYGVTMQERGVSKRVSVSLEEIGENGEIRQSGGKKNREVDTNSLSREGEAPLPHDVQTGRELLASMRLNSAPINLEANAAPLEQAVSSA